MKRAGIPPDWITSFLFTWRVKYYGDMKPNTVEGRVYLGENCSRKRIGYTVLTLSQEGGKAPAVYVTMEAAISQPDATGRER